MLKHIICEGVPSFKWSGQPVLKQDCLSCASKGENACRWTYPVLKAMFGGEPRTGIHVTSLTDCVRRQVIQEKVDYSVRPSDMWLMAQGTLIHKGVEDFSHDTDVIEGEFSRNVIVNNELVIPLLGRVDCIIPSQSLLRDYKRPKSLPKFPRDSHVAQVNVYRWLVAPKYDIQNLELTYLGASGSRRFKVPVWDNERVEGFIKSRVKLLYDYLYLEEEYPPHEEDLPSPVFCKGCNVKEFCLTKEEMSMFEQKEEFIDE